MTIEVERIAGDIVAKLNDWLKEDNLTLLAGWARDGLTDEQIANNMGIANSTLYEWKKKSKEFSEVLKKNKEIVDFEVENALLKSAMEGNVTAQIFWLKNRKKNEWREKIELPTNPNEISKVQELLNKIKDEANDIKWETKRVY